MRLALAVLLFLSGPAAAQVVPGHRLPGGPDRPVREREIDVRHLAASLRVDLDREEVAGTASVTFTPLRSNLQTVSLDATDPKITRITLQPEGTALRFVKDERSLRITLPRAFQPGEQVRVAIDYSARPRSGLYFFPKSSQRSPQAWNYGEGGLHYGWLPLYNDTNDRFSVEFALTVARPFVALSNGTLRKTTDNADGTRTFHWAQEQPIPNYLLALNVGEFERVSLGEARVGEKTVSTAAWGPPGTEDALAFSFRDTARMMEFFSERFGYAYPWDKYDQVTLREFSGAMETTTMVGFTETYQRRAGDPVDSSPSYKEAHPAWTYEDTIAHELAHHWFGDLVTCRSLGSLWLNESFATFAHTLWNGHAHGEDDLTYQRWRYLNRYLDHIGETGKVRPLEFFRYSSPSAMYQEETTYLKGALVLHMLRRVVGEADFYRALADYLRRHEYRSVDSQDLKAAFEASAGRELGWFFDDWITGGGGHPALEVSYRWVPERKQVDLTIDQVQSDLPFENDFRLPVDVEVVTASGAKLHRIELQGWTTQRTLPSEAQPLAVTFDKGGVLVAEVAFERALREVLFQLEKGGLAERLRAARQLATDFPRRVETVPALAGLLADHKTHWGLRQEAALDLGSVGSVAATKALLFSSTDPDRRIRRAVALGLAETGAPRAAESLRKMVSADAAEDVAGVAAFGLGRMHAEGVTVFLKAQLRRESRWWDAVRLGVLLGLAELEDPALIPTFRDFTDPRYRRQVRVAALDGWSRAGPADAAFARRLRELSRDRNLSVRSKALETLGKLHRAADAAFLKAYAEAEPDSSLAQTAREALEEIEAFVSH